MPISGADLISRVRRYYSEQTANRWTDADILQFASDVQIEIAQEVKVLEAERVFAGTPGVREYELPELIKILRVYVQIPNVSQERLVPTDIGTMEGEQIEYFDNTSGTVTNALQMSPQWLAEQEQPYPNYNAPQGGSTPTAPYQTVTLGGQRPVYYRRGGYIGLVPVPAAAFNLVLNYVPIPADVLSRGDFFSLPINFRDSLAYGVCQRMSISDRGADDPRSVKFGEQYGGAVGEQREWLNQIDGDKPKTPIVITSRSYTRYEDNC